MILCCPACLQGDIELIDHAIFRRTTKDFTMQKEGYSIVNSDWDENEYTETESQEYKCDWCHEEYDDEEIMKMQRIDNESINRTRH